MHKIDIFPIFLLDNFLFPCHQRAVRGPDTKTQNCFQDIKYFLLAAEIFDGDDIGGVLWNCWK